ncbi:MAG: NUDIX hydrolase [Chloroflexota bacterium]
MFTKDVIFFQKAVVKHPTDELFLILKRNALSSMPNMWEFPGGGVDFGEGHVEAIVREIQEETGLVVQNPQVLDVFSRFASESQTYRLCIGYQCEATSAQIQLSDEHTDYKWISTDDFATIDTWDFLKALVNKAYQAE